MVGETTLSGLSAISPVVLVGWVGWVGVGVGGGEKNQLQVIQAMGGRGGGIPPERQVFNQRVPAPPAPLTHSHPQPPPQPYTTISPEYHNPPFARAQNLTESYLNPFVNTIHQFLTMTSSAVLQSKRYENLIRYIDTHVHLTLYKEQLRIRTL